VDGLRERMGRVPLYKPKAAAFVDFYVSIENCHLLFVGALSNAAIIPMARLRYCQETLADNKPAILFHEHFMQNMKMNLGSSSCKIKFYLLLFSKLQHITLASYRYFIAKGPNA
jgi:hypothetical protein